VKWKQVKWLVCAGALVWSAALGCQRGDQAPELAWHGTVKIKSPITAVEQKCGGRRCAVQGHPSVDSIEYDANAAGDIKAVLVRYKLPKERSVKASRTLYEQARDGLKKELGEGKTYLASGDPYYWPRRDARERVVTITVDQEERPVLAVGAVGPGAEKIPAGGAARDMRQVQQWWGRILPVLQAQARAEKK
jgi:hypothetical protein